MTEKLIKAIHTEQIKKKTSSVHVMHIHVIRSDRLLHDNHKKSQKLYVLLSVEKRRMITATVSSVIVLSDI